MQLVPHARNGADTVRRTSPRGQLVIACLVGLMLLSLFSGAWEVALEAQVLVADGLWEFVASLGLRHWNLIELILAGAALSLSLCALLTTGAPPLKAMRPVPHRRSAKIPI